MLTSPGELSGFGVRRLEVLGHLEQTAGPATWRTGPGERAETLSPVGRALGPPDRLPRRLAAMLWPPRGPGQSPKAPGRMGRVWEGPALLGASCSFRTAPDSVGRAASSFPAGARRVYVFLAELPTRGQAVSVSGQPTSLPDSGAPSRLSGAPTLAEQPPPKHIHRQLLIRRRLACRPPLPACRNLLRPLNPAPRAASSSPQPARGASSSASPRECMPQGLA